MSMLTFYVNRAGRSLPDERRRVLDVNGLVHPRNPDSAVHERGSRSAVQSASTNLTAPERPDSMAVKSLGVSGLRSASRFDLARITMTAIEKEARFC
jgi:hypothetical protein